MRRWLIIGIIVLVLAAGLYFGRSYIFKFSEDETPVEETTPEVIETTTEEEIPDVLNVVSSVPAFDYWIDSTDRTIFFISPDGSLYRVSAGGIPEKIYSLGTATVMSVSPAPKGNLAVIKTGSQQTPFFAIVNPSSKTRQFLPLSTLAAAWSPDGKEIIIQKNTGLYIFTLASGKTRFVTSLNIIDILLWWGRPREIYIGQRPAAGILGSWWSYHLDKKTLKPIVEEMPGLTVSWAPDGIFGLMFSNKNDAGEESLQMIKADTASQTDLGLISLPDKCTSAAAIMYCGEPLSLDTNRLPDAYYQNSYTIDNVFRVELNPYLKKTSVYRGNLETTKVDVYRPIKVGSSLYFINRYDSRLYSLQLVQ